MQVQRPIFDQISTLKNLPSLPHILVKLIQACNEDNSNLNSISEIISKDPSLSAKILKLVNSAFFGLQKKIEDIHHAVALVGTNGVKNTAICACVYETFAKTRGNGAFNLKRFWWHSLRCAFLAKQIAAKLPFDHTDEAFLSGLLHDIGKLILWVNFREPYENILEKSRNQPDILLEEESRLGATHCEVAAWLLNHWNLQSIVSDAVLYHHETIDRVQQSFPLVQITYVANTLCQDYGIGPEEKAEQAQMILGLRFEDIQKFIAQSDHEAEEVARSLHIEIDRSENPDTLYTEKDLRIRDALIQEVRNESLLMGSLQGFLEAEDQADILGVISQGLKVLFDMKKSLFFLLDMEKGILLGHHPDEKGRYTANHNLAVSLKMQKSLLIRTLNHRRTLDSFSTTSKSPSMILDEQISRFLGKEGLFCLPMIAQGEPVGILVLGVDRTELSHLSTHTKLINVFVYKGALALRLEQLRRSRLQTIQAERMGASADLARRVIHEVNNPLGIIKNYLQILGMKLSEQQIAQDEIRIIKEEIDRVAQLLLELSQFSNRKAVKTEKVEINSLLLDILKLTRESLLKDSKVELQLDLERSLPKIAADKDGLKQVFINLVKNAAEAMTGGGNLLIQTRHMAGPIGGRIFHEGNGDGGYVEIIFKDNGPGIPEEIKEKLFDPYVGSKGEGHSGLGLSVAHNIIKSLKGNMICESIPNTGTVFRIELPVLSD